MNRSTIVDAYVTVSSFAAVLFCGAMTWFFAFTAALATDPRAGGDPTGLFVLSAVLGLVTVGLIVSTIRHARTLRE